MALFSASIGAIALFRFDKKLPNDVNYMNHMCLYKSKLKETKKKQKKLTFPVNDNFLVMET